MKQFRLFLNNFILKKPIVSLVLLILLAMANYMSFTAVRMVISTLEGREQLSRVSSEGTYIANLDPSNEMGVNNITDDSLKDIYEYLNKKYNYAFYTDGMVADLDNGHGFDVTVGYMSEHYNELDGFPISAGEGLRFDYDLGSADTIPVLVGQGLEEEYPLGSEFVMIDPALGRPVTLYVSGILEKDAARSNFYALDSKQYYNFSIIVPVTPEFILQSNFDLKLNGLNDLIITNASDSQINELQGKIADSIGMRYNFFSGQDNIKFYYSYFYPPMIFLGSVVMILISLIVVAAAWSSLTSVRLSISDFTIKLLVGMSYSQLKKDFYGYYFTLSGLVLTGIFILAAYSRQGAWSRGESLFITIGVFGMIGMDWFAILVTGILDVVLVVLLVHIVMLKVKRVPISMGVLQ